MKKRTKWLTCEQAATEIGMTAAWIRNQIGDRRLPAMAWSVGGRRTYRIRVDDWIEFKARYSRRTDDPDWE